MSRKRQDTSKDIAWLGSAARGILLEDFASGVLPLDEEVCSAGEAWEHYKELIEFALVPFSQFERQLKKHRQTLEAKDIHAMNVWSDFKKMREKHKAPTVYDNGNSIFCHSKAYDLLREDVYARRHLNFTPAAFRMTNEEYRKWDLKEFTQRIYQMERQWKFVNYLEKRREEKKQAFEASRNNAALEAIKLSTMASSKAENKKQKTS